MPPISIFVTYQLAESRVVKPIIKDSPTMTAIPFCFVTVFCFSNIPVNRITIASIEEKAQPPMVTSKSIILPS
jgi:hypothetical protein